jgi:transcriptional regulator with XRE-family HTH domain
MTNIRELLAINLKSFRAARGWSQAKLAEKAGISTQHIGMIETKIKFPSSAMIEKLAKALNIDPAELFYREIDPEMVRKNAEKAVIGDFGEAFYNLINDFVAEKIKEIDGENGKAFKERFSELGGETNDDNK